MAILINHLTIRDCRNRLRLSHDVIILGWWGLSCCCFAVTSVWHGHWWNEAIHFLLTIATAHETMLSISALRSDWHQSARPLRLVPQRIRVLTNLLDELMALVICLDPPRRIVVGLPLLQSLEHDRIL